MRHITKLTLLLLTLPLLAQTSAPSSQPATTQPDAPKVDNPMYAVWANANPGTKLTLSFLHRNGTNTDSQPDFIFQLVKVTPDAVTLDWSTADKPQSRTKLEVPAKVSLGEEPLFFLLPASKRMALRSSAHYADKITLAGNSIDATCYSADFGPHGKGSDVPRATTTIKAWFAPSQPCPFVLMELSTPEPSGSPHGSTITVTSWEPAPTAAPATQP